MQPPGLLRAGSVQVRALTRAGPAGFLPLSTAGTLQLGRHLPGMLLCFTASVSLAVKANHFRLGGIREQCPSVIILLLRGLGVMGSVSSRSGFLLGVDGAESGSSHLQGFHKHGCGG